MGLLLALALRSGVRGSGAFRLVFVLPVMATGAAMTLIWKLFFDTYFGPINELLALFDAGPIPWLQEAEPALAAVVSVEVWRSSGYALLLFSAGLAGIPVEVEQAAIVDGAHGPARFRHVIWPLLAPTTLFVVVVLTARSFQAFDTVRVLTNGGPQRATHLLSHMLFEEAFGFFNTGYASALAIVFFALALSVSLAQFLLDRKVHYR